MGVLDRFEKGIERAVSGAFAKAFRSEVQPVEIASALRRECDDRAAVIGRDRTIVPNAFVVELGPADHERLGEWQDALAEELRDAVEEHAVQQRYSFVGPLSVAFEQTEDLDTGVFRVRSATTKPAERPAVVMNPPPSPFPAFPDPVASPIPPAPSSPPRGEALPLSTAPPPIWGDPRPQAPGPAPGMPAPGVPAPGGPAPAPTQTVATLDVDGRMYRITTQVTVIGRAADVDVVLDDPGVSRRHAEVHVLDGQARLVDLGSTNGTFVDGERVHAGLLADGSTIAVGRSRIVYRSGQR